MVRDRMPDLLASRSSSSTFGRGFLQDVHIQIAQNKKLKELLDKAEEIRALIHLTVENIAIVKDLHSNILSHTNKDLGKDISITDDFTIASTKDEPVYRRIKILQYTTMMQLFSEIMEDYNTSLLRYHDKCLLLLQQQRSLLRRQVTSEELDHMLDARETSLFVDNILEDSRVAKQQLSDIQSRHDDVLKLEKLITEVRDMFAEMAVLIEIQGEQINNIEYFANKTTDNIDGGNVQIKTAEKRIHKRKKQKMVKIIIVIAIIIIVLLFIIILK